MEFSLAEVDTDFLKKSSREPMSKAEFGSKSFDYWLISFGFPDYYSYINIIT